MAASRGGGPVAKLARLLFGFLMLVLGAVGLFLPGLQGILFLAIGAGLLAPDVPLFARLLAWMERKFSRVFKRR